MRDTLTKRDWETISAYLDGQLSARKQAHFESRLQQDQQLRIALEEMQHTRGILRNTPKLRAPRSFVLTPALAGQPRRLPRLAPIFGWASAVASFLFVIFFVGDLFTTGGAIPMALNNFPQQQDEFIVPKSGVAENDTASQAPSDAGGMEAAAQPMVEAPAPQITDDEMALEAAASEDSVPAAENATSRSVEPAEEDVEVAELPEIIPTEGLPDTSVTFGASPEEETPVPDAREVEINETADPEESFEAREGEGDLIQVASITETLLTETATMEEPEALQVEEAFTAQEEQQPSEKAAPTDVSAQPLAEYQANDTTVPELTKEDEWGFAADVTSDEASAYVIGVEVILALLAFSTGFAWFYLRRRGG
jgi:hypothetical protein